MKRLVLIVALSSVFLSSAVYGQTAAQNAESAKFIRSLKPAQTIINRKKKAIRLKLCDRASTISLPVGWACRSRGVYTTLSDSHRVGMFSHYIYPVKGKGGIRLTIMYDSNGSFGELLDAEQLQIVSDRFGGDSKYYAWEWAGLKGILIESKSGKLHPSHDELLGLDIKPLYTMTVASSNASYSVQDSTQKQERAVKAMLNSFKPGL